MCQAYETDEQPNVWHGDARPGAFFLTAQAFFAAGAIVTSCIGIGFIIPRAVAHAALDTATDLIDHYLVGIEPEPP